MNDQDAQYQKVSFLELLTMCQIDQARSDAQVAKAIGLGERIYQMARAGKVKLPARCLKPLAEVLNVSPEVVLTVYLHDYQPELLSALCQAFHPFPLSEDERRTVLALRAGAAAD